MTISTPSGSFSAGDYYSYRAYNTNSSVSETAPGNWNGQNVYLGDLLVMTHQKALTWLGELKPFLQASRRPVQLMGWSLRLSGLFPAGRADNSASTTYYATQSQTMRQNLINSCKAASGQTFDPIYLINQIGNTYINTMGVPQAQNRLPEQADKTILVGSYHGLPNPGAHLCSNSYRNWLLPDRITMALLRG
ncbi:hypothetical protein AB7B76_06295 [Klebsiella pneumoniae]